MSGTWTPGPGATTGDDTYAGTTGANTADGLAGNDSLYGNSGNDLLTGNDGNDTLVGGNGLDTMNGGAGNDSMVGDGQGATGTEADTFNGGDGNDIMVGAGGNDSMLGGADNDSILGNAGNDTINAGDGDDRAFGGTGDDSMDGGIGNDYLDGGDGVDTLRGGDGNDTLLGGTGTGSDEILDGGSGNDFIVVGATTDIVIGGGGDDTVNLSAYGGGRTWTETSTGSNIWISSTSADTISGVENFTNNGTTFFRDPNLTIPSPCFATGTRIATARGEVVVEDLRVGDLVVTAQRGTAPLQPVVWIGHSQANIARHPDRAAVAPVLIKAGALSAGAPNRDLRVSPDHAMFLDGRLVPAKHLVNGTSIVQQLWCPEVTYWHVELPAHGLLVAEGAVSESYFDDGNRKHFDNHAITTLFKDFASERANGRYAEAACYPLLEGGEALDRIRLRLAQRAMELEAGAEMDRRTA